AREVQRHDLGRQGDRRRRPCDGVPEVRERRLSSVAPARRGSAQPRTVKVGGGKGTVVGDFNTVIQIFREAPPALSSQIRTQEFTALIEERTRNFVGREYVFAAVDEALQDDDFASGYVVLQGEPGIGKTAIVGQLVKAR